MTAEKLDNLTKRFASEVAEFEKGHNGINGGFVTGLFRKYLIEADKEIWNAAIDAAAEGAKMEAKKEFGFSPDEKISCTTANKMFNKIIDNSILNLKK
jgi:hypothetical protein